MKRFFAPVWVWFTAKASRTWVAHGLVSLAPSCVAAWLGGLFWMSLASGVMLLFFLFREFCDERKYTRQEWDEPRWRDAVRPSTDQAGDLMGPVFVFATSTAAWWLT